MFRVWLRKRQLNFIEKASILGVSCRCVNVLPNSKLQQLKTHVPGPTSVVRAVSNNCSNISEAEALLCQAR